MKNIILIAVTACSFAFGQGTQLTKSDFLLQANSNLKTKNGRIGLITIVPVVNAKDETTFGYWLSNNTNANAVFLEVKEGQKTIASLTAKEFSGKVKIKTEGAKTLSSYVGGSGANAFTLVIESDTLHDVTMPLGKAIVMNVKIKTAGVKNLSAVMTLYADGFVKKIGANSITSSRVENGKPEYPLAMIVGTDRSSVTADQSEQKAPGKLIKIISPPVGSTGDEITLLTFYVQQTTIKNYNKSLTQAQNIESVNTTKKTKTELSLLNSANNPTPHPGDTITYYITYHNIGTATAQDIVITNPIPSNTAYIENSAIGDGAEVSVDRKKVTAPQQGEVISVTWKVTKKVSPGDEGVVSFKALVR